MDMTIRPRVLMLTSTLPRWVGDAEPGFVLDLARELNTDFDVELVAPHAEGAAGVSCCRAYRSPASATG